MNISKLTTAAAVSAMLVVPMAAEATEAKASTALNVRAAPTVFADINGVLDMNQNVTIEGCLEDVSWCKISSDDLTGWASGRYLTVATDAKAVPMLDASGNAQIEFAVISEDDLTEAEDTAIAAAGGTLGALAAFALGGPAATIALSGVAGTVAADLAVEPAEETYVFVTANPVEPVFLDGEVVVGATVPDDIETYELPQEEFRYLNVNNNAVVVDAESNTIVAVLQ